MSQPIDSSFAEANMSQMEETQRVLEAWKATDGQLPDGWAVESLQCASISLRDTDRSEDWIATAVGRLDPRHL
jgi:hypothetical protein